MIKWLAVIGVIVVALALSVASALLWHIALTSSDLATVMSVGSGVLFGWAGSQVAMLVWMILDDKEF